MRTKLGFFAALYFLQGAALAYVVNFQKPYLAAHGVSKESLGAFTSLLLIPFVAKVALGAWSDRVGRRKGFMVSALAVFALCYVALAQFDPGRGFLTFAAVAWIGSAALAWFDTCADGWAIDVAEELERGPIQAAMIAGKSLGLIVTSFAFGYLAHDLGYGRLFGALAGLAVLVLLLVLATPYRPRPRAPAENSGWHGFRRADFAWFALYGVTYSVASFGTDGLLTLHLMETRLASAAVIGWFGAARGLGALFGAWAYVRVSARWGDVVAERTALALLGLGCLLPLAGVEVGTAGVLWGAAWGLQETAFVTLAMRLATGPWAATTFALAMMCSNVGTSLGEALAAPLVPALGYGGVFTGAAVLAWAAAWFLVKTRASALR